MSKYNNISDQELLNYYYADGNSEWLGIILQRYTLLLLGVCMKYLKNEEEAKDSVQQIFLKAIQELGKYRVDYFKSWLYMVAKNHCLMQIREKQKKQVNPLYEDQLSIASEETDISELQSNDLTISLMQEGLNSLSEEQRQSVILFYLDKKSYQEISDSTGYNYLQVKSYIQNGKRNLRIWIEKQLKKRTEQE